MAAGVTVCAGVVEPGTTVYVMIVEIVSPLLGGVVVVLPAGADGAVVVGTAVVGVVAAAVLGPLAEIGLTSCTLCAGNLGFDPPGAKTTNTTRSAPTTPRPANIPARCDATSLHASVR